MFMLFALTLTTLAGLSTGLGGLVVLLFKRPRARMMAFSMGFAGGVMLTVSLSDMLPHTVEPIPIPWAGSRRRWPLPACA